MNSETLYNKTCFVLLAIYVFCSVIVVEAVEGNDCEFTDDENPKYLGIEADHIIQRLDNTYYMATDLLETGMLSEEEYQSRLAMSSKLVDEGDLSKAGLNQDEIDCLREIFGRDKNKNEVLKGDYQQLANLAASSMNNDDVPDFIIGKFGRFFENHHDIDGDSVDNHLDPNPLVNIPKIDRHLKDHDGDLVPNHLDWDLTRKKNKNNKHSGLQACLYERENCTDVKKKGRNHRLLLIEKESKFSDSTLYMLEDVLYKVFNDCTVDHPYCKDAEIGFESVTKVYASGRAYIEGKKRKYKFKYPLTAEVHPGSRTIYIYNIINPQDDKQKLKSWNDFKRFIILSHEFLHAFQYSFDYPSTYKRMQKEYVYQSSSFEKYINEKYKSILNTKYQEKYDKAEERKYHKYFLNENDDTPSSYSSNYNEKSIASIREDIKKITKNFNCSDLDELKKIEKCKALENYEIDELYKDNGMVRGLNDSIFELHAHLFEAYLVRAVTESYVVNQENASVNSGDIYQCMRDSGIFKFRFPENLDDDVFEHLNKAFPLTENELNSLVTRYFDFDPKKFNTGHQDDWCRNI